MADRMNLWLPTRDAADVDGTGDVLIVQDGTTKRITPAQIASLASGGDWTAVVDQDGTSFADWTAVSGTWNSDGSVIRCTTSGANQLAYLASPTIDSSECIVEFDVQFGAASGYAGFGFTLIGGVDVTNSLQIYLHDGRVYYVLRNTALGHSFPYSPLSAADTWFTVRFVVHGSSAAVFVDGVYAGAVMNTHSSAAMAAGLQFSLHVDSTTAKFRNLKVWTPPAPSLP